MNDLQLFHFESRDIRVVEGASAPWWIAADVCNVLGLDNPSMAVGRLDDDERGISSIDTPSGPQQMLIINESGLYSLIMTSRKPDARRFRKWITSEVLPALRRTGRYAIRPAEDPLLTQARLHLETVRRQVELERVQREQQGQLEELRTQVGLTSTHMTLRGWCAKHKIKLSQSESSRVGKVLAKLSRDKGLDVQKVADLKYGEVNAYPVEVLAGWMELYRQAVG
jgi:prophage antirepressor-like protein